ncbi:MAG: hypothetical protein Q8P59_00780, partial [Dehalococcoidia bacterium]|nr:hypothetical protein [Dehalococcoidia bacterium]
MRRIDWRQDILVTVAGIVLTEVLVFAFFMLPWPLSAAPAAAIVGVLVLLFCLVRTEQALVALFFLGISTQSFPVFDREVGSLYLNEVLIAVILMAYILQVL